MYTLPFFVDFWPQYCKKILQVYLLSLASVNNKNKCPRLKQCTWQFWGSIGYSINNAIRLLDLINQVINFWFFFSEPVLSSNELDEIQYNISTPGSFAFAERPTGSVSIKQRKQLFCRLKHIKIKPSIIANVCKVSLLYMYKYIILKFQGRNSSCFWILPCFRLPVLLAACFRTLSMLSTLEFRQVTREKITLLRYEKRL